MSIQQLFAVAPVRDHEAAVAWYQRFFGREPDDRPMDGLAEWRVTGGGCVQIVIDPGRAGQTLLNLAVDDIEAEAGRLAGHRIPVTDRQTVTGGVRLGTVTDPDGNLIRLLEAPAAKDHAV